MFGALTTQVEVFGEAPVINTENASMGIAFVEDQSWKCCWKESPQAPNLSVRPPNMSIGAGLWCLQAHRSEYHAALRYVAVGSGTQHQAVVLLVLTMAAIAGSLLLAVNPQACRLSHVIVA